jgi:hypothetical protein
MSSNKAALSRRMIDKGLDKEERRGIGMFCFVVV